MGFKGGGHGCSKPNCENDVFDPYAPQPYVVDLNDTEWTVDHYEKYIKQRKQNRINQIPENPRLTTFRVKELDLSGYNKDDREPVDLKLICSNFPNVEKLILANNGLTELPDCIAYLEKLHWLDVNENPLLTTLPYGFSSWDSSKHLYLLMDDITSETKEVLPAHFLINSMMNTKQKQKQVEIYNIPSSSRSTTSENYVRRMTPGEINAIRRISANYDNSKSESQHIRDAMERARITNSEITNTRNTNALNTSVRLPSLVVSSQDMARMRATRATNARMRNTYSGRKGGLRKTKTKRRSTKRRRR
jgi:hypothetical protein